jgi:acetyltransferase-like isoleucine patch superfamily enzyme
VVIEDNVIIEDYCTIGYPTPLAEGLPLILGRDSLIRSYSLFYQGSEMGPNLKTGHRVTVREKTTAGRDLQIGTLCDIQGHCTIGDHVRLHSNIFIGQKSRIANFVWLFPFVVLTNDPHPPSDGLTEGPQILDYASIGAASCIMPGIRIGRHVVIAAHSLVHRDVEDHTAAGGVPAKILCKAKDVALRNGQGPAYPWPRHFRRGYPEHVVAEWEKGNYDYSD